VPEDAGALRLLWGHIQRPQSQPLRQQVRRVWWKWLNRRSRTRICRGIGSAAFWALSVAESENRPQVRVAKPYPEEPYALIALVRICGGSGRVTSQFYPEVRPGLSAGF